MSEAALAPPPPPGETLRQRMTVPAADWSPENAGSFALPPEPDAETAPTLHALWVAMLAEPLHLVAPDIEDADAGEDDEVEKPRPRARAVIGSGLGSGHVMGSRNWSGLLVAPGQPERIEAIGGAWIVPAATPDLDFKPLDGIWRLSTWVGLDGHFAFAASLPQLGTESEVTKAGPALYRSWFQWWVPQTNTRPHYVRNFIVTAGDRVGCYLWKTADDEVGMLFRHLDAPDDPVVALRLRGQILDADGTRAQVRGTTGEWVVERPQQLESRKLYPLPKFAPVTFDHASAGARGPTTPDGVRDTLTGGRMIRLFAPVKLPEVDGVAIEAAVRLVNAERLEGNGIVVSRVTE